MTREQEREIQLVKLFASSMTNALAALEEQPHWQEEKARLLQKNQQLSRELSDYRAKTAHLEKCVSIYGKHSSVEICPNCLGEGGWSFEGDANHPPEGVECEICNAVGFINKSELEE